MIRLGCVADDYTGATDVASALRRAGLHTTLFFGEPRPDWTPADGEAAVVALKIRGAPAADAARAARAAAVWLGADRLYYKFCSTFDSTDAGAIGPVADALVEASGARLTVVCPAAPQHGRTVYMGHLFVGDRLLSESAMRDHPLTPMRDPDLVRVLGRQTPHAVALVPHPDVAAGPTAVTRSLAGLAGRGVRYAVVDAIDDADLACLAAATADLPVVTGAAGLAAALAAYAAATGPARPPSSDPALPEGPTVVLAGSCSPATLAQVETARKHLPAYRLDRQNTADSAAAAGWLDRHLGAGAALLYSSAAPHERVAGLESALERAMGHLARHAVAIGARRVVVAGGETAGAVVEALGVTGVTLGAEADPGVPWMATSGRRPLALLLKSGNFGRPDLFLRASGIGS